MQPNVKTIFTALMTLCLFSFSTFAQISEPTGYDGDGFSLEGALSLFEEAKSLEDFEKALNTEKNHVNNLDLNEDGEIDYIRVIDNMDGDVHAIVLQVPLDAKESQDIAVIEIEKTGKESALLQIIGDEDVYGEATIVEPFDVNAEQIGKGPSAQFTHTRVVFNVWVWPSVRFVYGPRYRPYVSPWAWRTYPRYWRPWRPHPYSFHVANRYVKPHFRLATTHRVVRAHRVYTPRRTSSVTVRKRTTVVKNRNGQVVGAKTKTTKTVRGKNGNVKAKKSTTKGVRKTKKGKVRGKKKTTKVRKVSRSKNQF